MFPVIPRFSCDDSESIYPDEDGEWVSYEDYYREIQKKNREIANLQRKLNKISSD